MFVFQNKHLLFLLSIIFLSLSFAFFFNPETVQGDTYVQAQVEEFSELAISDNISSKSQFRTITTNSESGVAVIVMGSESVLVDKGESKSINLNFLNGSHHNLLVVPRF